MKISERTFIFIFRMIKAILIFNNQGKPRLTKFYQHYTEKEQQGIIEVRILQKFLEILSFLELVLEVKILDEIFSRFFRKFFLLFHGEKMAFAVFSKEDSWYVLKIQFKKVKF